jgi:PTS system glucose-specific IIC component
MVSKRAKQSFGEIDLIKQKRNNGGNFKEIIAKLSRGLMLPIAMLPIAGLALGIGTTIYSQSHSDIGQMIGNIIMMPGSIIFSILPLLFCVAIAITFTGDAGTAGLSGLVGYAVFAVFQTALIIYPHGSDPNYHFL